MISEKGIKNNKKKRTIKSMKNQKYKSTLESSTTKGTNNNSLSIVIPSYNNGFKVYNLISNIIKDIIKDKINMDNKVRETNTNNARNQRKSKSIGLSRTKNKRASSEKTEIIKSIEVIEIIIIDDFSTDNTQELIQSLISEIPKIFKNISKSKIQLNERKIVKKARISERKRYANINDNFYETILYETTFRGNKIRIIYSLNTDSKSKSKERKSKENKSNSKNKTKIKNIIEFKNKGAAAARNKGYELSKGLNILFIDSDIIINLKAILNMVGVSLIRTKKINELKIKNNHQIHTNTTDAFTDTPTTTSAKTKIITSINTSTVNHRTYKENVRNNRHNSIINTRTPDIINQKYDFYDIIYPTIIYPNQRIFYPESEKEKKVLYVSSCFLMRREAIEKLINYYGYLFDENYTIYNEDSDLFFRALLLNERFHYVRNTVVIHKPDKKNISKLEKTWHLNIRNLAYGHCKLKTLITNTKDRKLISNFKRYKNYNPFSRKIILKTFILSAFNFAWFEFSKFKPKIEIVNKYEPKKENIISKTATKKRKAKKRESIITEVKGKIEGKIKNKVGYKVKETPENKKSRKTNKLLILLLGKNKFTKHNIIYRIREFFKSYSEGLKLCQSNK